jgi:hypothetical protein
MKTSLAILAALAAAFASTAHAQTELPGKLVQQIPLPIEGWMDHLSVDVRGGRLFVPAEQQRSLEVVDVKTGKIIHEITGFAGAPRKSVYLSGPNEIWIDDGESVKAQAPTKGRVLDHIGFDVKDPQAFIKKIEAEGIKLDEPYRKNETTGVAITYVTDPWGTRIELVQRAPTS